MLEPLLRLVEQDAQQQIVQNKNIPNQFNNAAIREVTNQIVNNLKSQVSQGHMQEIVSMFQSGSRNHIGNNPMISNMVASVSLSLTSKFGISQQVAESIASNLVPTVMNHVIKKANDPHDIDFDLQQMMRSMSGNNALDISGMVNQAPKGTMGSIGNVFGKLFKK